MNRAVYLTLGLLVVTLGCSTNQLLTDQQKDSVVKEVSAVSQQFWHVYSQPNNSESLANIMGFIDEKSDQGWQTDPALVVFNTNIFKSRADLEAVWKEMLTLRGATNVQMLENYFTVLSGNQVLEVNVGDYTITGKDGLTFGPYKMVNTIIWINRSGTWKIQHCHESWVSEKE